MRRSTFKILFYVNKQRMKEGRIPVYARLTVNGKSTFVNCRTTLPSALWDSKANKAAGKSFEAQTVNRKLEHIRAQIERHYQRISDRDAYVTVERVKQAYLGMGEEYETLLEAFDKFNRDFKQHVGVDRAQSTYRKYDNVRKRLAEFLHAKLHREDIPLKELTETFITEYDLYLRGEKGLTQEMIQRSFDGDLWIVKRRQKTDTPFKIKLCGITKRIITRYKREVSGTNLVLPVPDIAYCNRVLKKIAAEVGIDKTITYQYLCYNQCTRTRYPHRSGQSDAGAHEHQDDPDICQSNGRHAGQRIRRNGRHLLYQIQSCAMKREIIKTDESGNLILPADMDEITMTEYEIAELFGVFTPTVRAAIKAVYKSGVIREEDAKRYLRIANRNRIEVYSIETIIVLAFRVDSFGANKVREYLFRTLRANR